MFNSYLFNYATFIRNWYSVGCLVRHNLLNAMDIIKLKLILSITVFHFPFCRSLS